MEIDVQLGIGFVGAGFAADTHAKAWLAVQGASVELVGVCSASRSSAEAFSRRFGVRSIFDNYQDLVADPRVDVVCIAVPNHLHADVLIAAAEAGKHLVCEKPLTGGFVTDWGLDEQRLGRARADAMSNLDRVEAALSRSDGAFLYAENWIYSPGVTKIRELHAVSGGRILHMSGGQSHSGSHSPAARRPERAGGGALITLGAHPIGTLVHLKQWEGQLFGRESNRVVSVTASCASLDQSAAWQDSGDCNFLTGRWSGLDTWACLTMTFEDGSTAVVTASFATLGGVRDAIEVACTNSVYRSNMVPNDSLMTYAPDEDVFRDTVLREKLEHQGGWQFTSVSGLSERGYVQQLEALVTAIRTGRQPESSFSVARSTVEVIYAGYLSAGAGRRVDLL